VLWSGPCPAHAETLRFNRDIRPILSDNCFLCHGPADAKGDLRLDLRNEAIKKRDSGQAITPGSSATSELVKRITHADPEERMPPEDSGRHLRPDQVEKLRQWIDQGAEWELHWAFITPKELKPPEVEGLSHPVDRWVQSRLTREGVQPAPPAPKRTLLRRLSLDLTGLPPTLAEYDAFLLDTSPNAYEMAVDRLLASPRFGERMAMDWLDAARYADTHGYSLDRRRVMWPWRDWVIKALNDNMPFDQFAVEQLAGDLLPEATREQLIATGFNRNHSIQSEGGVINEEYRVETVVDRVETTSAIFLGLTFGCARCHDHKYDPISQEAFYRFYAFFNNVPETAHVGNKDKAVDAPSVAAPGMFHGVEVKHLKERITALEKQAQTELETQAEARAVERVWIDDVIPADAESLGNQGGAQKFEFVSAPHPVFSGTKASMRVSKGLGQHLVHNAKQGITVGENGRLFTYVYLDPKNKPKQIMLQWHVGGWEHRAVWGGDHIPWGKPGTVSRHAMGSLPKAGEWVRLEVKAEEVGLSAKSVIRGWAFTQFDGTVYWDKAGIVSLESSQVERELSEAKQALAALDKSLPVTMVMGEMKTPRKTFVLFRGQYDQPTETQVTPGLPAVFGSLSKTQAADRLALARWLVSPGNPLTARVTVSRYWQMFFGEGLVKTPEDYGSQGALPVHPELLDWLALEFVRSGWDVKGILKTIVLSKTYQQASTMTPESLARDPENRLLARGPRYRLPAEMIRDQALMLSGLLVEKLGGESVKPYQPPGLWGDVVYENAPRFKQDHGDKLYRRSLYTFWKRSVPPPNLQIFDAPTREACVLKRSRTNTPLAALVLMNDPTYVEASRKWAERILLDGGDTVDDRLVYAFETVTGRSPKVDEREEMKKVFDQIHAAYQADPAAAKALLKVGESPVNPACDPVELATYAAIANALLNLDETISKN
jgi:hypothetical protein